MNCRKWNRNKSKYDFMNTLMPLCLAGSGGLQLREYWKDLEYRLHHILPKFYRSVFLNLKPFLKFLLAYIYIWLGFLFKNYWLEFEKKPFQFWQEIWIQVVVILLQLYPSLIGKHVSLTPWKLCHALSWTHNSHTLCCIHKYLLDLCSYVRNI